MDILGLSRILTVSSVYLDIQAQVLVMGEHPRMSGIPQVFPVYGDTKIQGLVMGRRPWIIQDAPSILSSYIMWMLKHRRLAMDPWIVQDTSSGIM